MQGCYATIPSFREMPNNQCFNFQQYPEVASIKCTVIKVQGSHNCGQGFHTYSTDKVLRLSQVLPAAKLLEAYISFFRINNGMKDSLILMLKSQHPFRNHI